MASLPPGKDVGQGHGVRLGPGPPGPGRRRPREPRRRPRLGHGGPNPGATPSGAAVAGLGRPTFAWGRRHPGRRGVGGGGRRPSWPVRYRGSGRSPGGPSRSSRAPAAKEAFDADRAQSTPKVIADLACRCSSSCNVAQSQHGQHIVGQPQREGISDSRGFLFAAQLVIEQDDRGLAILRLGGVEAVLVPATAVHNGDEMTW